MDKLTLSVRDLCERLGVSKPTAYALCRREGFPCIEVGKKLLIPAAELERWLSEEARNGRSI
jgi:excisionase family DNA binding protein